MVLLREPLPDRGIAVRIVVDDVADIYRVEYTPLSGGVVTDEWTVFGGVSECKQACSCNTWEILNVMIPNWQLLLSVIAIVLGYAVSGLIQNNRRTDVVYRVLLSVGTLSAIYVLIAY
ncbi:MULTISPECIES: hypothetical protein [unclassified Haloferax]|uniref:hypothetical protein n=1 Tax=unclassified Haloferax TaxID=2625095 RepID=UPI000E22F616|nr:MULTISPECIES: hypothetical protein [unclassified Haloferax]RDZ34082.1 hypothetical protein C5B88_15745 [Haloferax sp. Atlit-24N]RLM36214.1 hypothetical protein DVK03_15685 [Haloferax sp. Atlit-109R]RLM41581.1 hypothetical protein DVK04_14680 [Haloferax sp. Atlit-105R]